MAGIKLNSQYLLQSVKTFVLNISDDLINRFLISAFGFCDYGDPESGLRSIRLLHNKVLGDKALVVSKSFASVVPQILCSICYIPS